MNPRALIIFLFAIVLFSSSVVAERKRLSLAPVEGVYSTEDIEQEMIFGREMAAILLADRKLVVDQQLTRYVNLVGQSLVLHANRPELSFYFAVVESDQINAYAVPGGYIFITTAALALMNNEAELAGVLAHEIAHITDRHIVKALDLRAADNSLTATIGIMVGSSAESANIVFYQAVDSALELLFSEGLSHDDEFEADEQGVYLAAFAGYDVYSYLEYLQRISTVVKKKANAQKETEISKTHPLFSQRLRRLESIIQQAGLVDAGNVRNKKRFEGFVVNVR